jgi:hypothetical protein
LTLSNGFEPDPQGKRMSSGGSVNVVEDLGLSHCLGYAAINPDFQVNWSGGGFLRFIFDPDSSGEKTTVIVNYPNGNWLCSDDKTGTNPFVDFHDAPTGIYNIWVASHSSDEAVVGSLLITQFFIRP